MIRFLLKSTLFLFLLPSVLFGADYYTDCNVAGPGAGTSGDPFDDIQASVDSATYGDTIHIANTATCTLSTDIVFNTGFTNAGQAFDSWLTFKAWDNGGSKTITTASGAVVDAFEVDGNSAAQEIFDYATMPSIARMVFIGMYAYGATGNTLRATQRMIIKDSYISGATVNSTWRAQSGQHQFFNTIIENTSSGIAVEMNAGSTLHGCRVESATGSYAVYLLADYSNVINSVIITTGGHGIGILAGNSNFISGNTIIGSATASKWGIYNFDGEMSAYNNLIKDFSGTTAGGIKSRVSGTDAMAYVGYNSFYNNTSNYDTKHIVLDDTGNDLTESSDPLVGSGDYSLVTGTNSEDAAWQIENGLRDIGAVESTASGGGAATTACGFVQ